MTPTDPLDPHAALSAGEDHAVPVIDEPEYESVDAFAEYLADDDRTTYRPAELVKLVRRTKLSRDAIAAGLAAYGYGPASK